MLTNRRVAWSVSLCEGWHYLSTFYLFVIELMLQMKNGGMMESNTKSAATNKNDVIKNCTTYVTCCTSAYKLSKGGWRQHKQSNCRRDHVQRIGWCGFRSLVSSLTSRLTAGIANQRGIPTSSSDVWAQTRLQSPSPSKEINLAKEFSENCRNVPCATDAEGPNISVQSLAVKAAESGKDEKRSLTSIGTSEGEANGMKKTDDDDCSAWWWWDTAGYDLTSVTPADVSTFWNEFNSWLTTTALKDDSSLTEMKPNILDSNSSSSSSSSSTAQRVTSVSGMLDEDETAKKSDYENTGEMDDDPRRCHSALKTALLQATSHGHRDVVYDILQQTIHARNVRTMDIELYDFINCRDSQVLSDRMLYRLAASFIYSSLKVSHEVCRYRLLLASSKFEEISNQSIFNID